MFWCLIFCSVRAQCNRRRRPNLEFDAESKLEFDAELICRLEFLIASKNKVLRAISRFRAPPRKCRNCANRPIFVISFERDRAFKFCFEGLEAHVPEPQKQKENLDQLCLQACGRARCADFGIERQYLTCCIF